MKQDTIRKITMAVVLVALASSLFVAAPVSAQNESVEEKAPLYENTTQPDTSDWLDGADTDLPGIVTMVSRVGTFIIGGGGSGISGQLLSGVVVLGIGVGAVARANVGSAAGGVLGVTAIFAAVGTGIAPEWLSVVVMFAIGLVLASVFRRVVG